MPDWNITDAQIDGLLQAAKYLGAALSVGLGALGPAIGIGYAGGKGPWGMARQPAESGQTLKTMLIGQAVTGTTGVFALVIAFRLVFGAAVVNWVHAGALAGAGFCMGASAFGSALGSGLAAGAAVEGAARVPESRGRVTMTMLITQAIAQTPSIFGFVIAVLLMEGHESVNLPRGDWNVLLPRMAAFLGAGIAMGAGASGPGLGIGYVGAEACDGMARNLDESGLITRTMFVGSAVATSTSIYSLVIALILWTIGRGM